jgi:hypothetical protein
MRKKSLGPINYSSIGGLDPPTQSFLALGGRIKCAHGGMGLLHRRGARCFAAPARSAGGEGPPDLRIERLPHPFLFSFTAALISALKAFSLIFTPSVTSMARRTLPSRLEVKSFAGSGSDAPLAKVSFTLSL